MVPAAGPGSEYSTRYDGRTVIASAYLRVFQPLDVFPEDERARWERYILEGEHLRPPRRRYRQRYTAASGRLGVLVSEGEGADVRMVDGIWYVCPWRTRLRVLAGLLSLRDSVPSEMAEELVPEGEARRAARELARIRRRDPAAVPTMLQSAWHVPLRWFVMVDEDERRVAERPEGGWRLYYWSGVGEARRRADRALEILRRSDLDSLADLVRDLAAWLAVFDPRSALELDYADLSGLFGWNELDDDHSAREIRDALDSLGEGDIPRAVDLYQQVAARWAEARTRGSLN
jgi:hypothetical protein